MASIFILWKKLEYLSAIVFHAVILKCLKKGKKQEMLLHFYVKDKIGVSIIDSIPRCDTVILSEGAK